MEEENQEESIAVQYKALYNLAEELAKSDLVRRYGREYINKFENSETGYSPSMGMPIGGPEVFEFFKNQKEKHLQRLFELRRLEIIVKNKGIILSNLSDFGGAIPQQGRQQGESPKSDEKQI